MVETSNRRKIFSLDVDLKSLESQFLDLNIALKRAVVNTTNKVGRKANREIAKDIKANFNIKQKSLRLGKTVRLRRADARKDDPVFRIVIFKKGRGLFLFGAKKGRRGVSVLVKKSRKTVKGSFFITSKSRNKTFVARRAKSGGTVERTSRSGRRYKAPRSKFLFGPSIASLYASRRSRKVLEKVINEGYQKELDDQFNRQFEKRR